MFNDSIITFNDSTIKFNDQKFELIMGDKTLILILKWKIKQFASSLKLYF